MTLSNKQKHFTHLVVKLFEKAWELGYEITVGDAYRDPRAFGAIGKSGPYGQTNSCHKLRLAIDLNLFTTDGQYLDKTDDHKKLGEYWESLDPLCRWGGRFNDGNHYSLEHDGFR